MKKLLFIILLPLTLFADIADPWWDTAWRYRVEVNIPTADIGQTGKINVDFTALGLPGTFDPASVRIVKQDGVTVLAEQEFNDNIYNDLNDGTSNSTGEVKFIVEDVGVVRYYMYYDSVDNGPYTPLAAAASVNGNFEYDLNKWATKDRWLGAIPDNAITTGVTKLVTDTVGTGQTLLVTGSTHTGSKAHLLGYQTNAEAANKTERAWIQRTIVVPTINPGTFTFWLRHQGWDDISRDFFHLDLGNNNTVWTGGSTLVATYFDSGWVQYSADLTPFAGTAVIVSLGMETAKQRDYKTWGTFDDIEWSLTTPALGAQESIIKAEVTKASCVINDSINIAANAKRIPGATVRYALQLSNTGLVDITGAVVTDVIPANMNASTVRNIQVQLGVCDCLGVASASNNGPLGSADGVDPVKIDYQGINVGQLKCGYFEVDVN